jgi:hypothetical protein
MTLHQLLQDYIAADKKRIETNGSWGPQWGIHNKLNDLGYYIERCEEDDIHLEKRKGYWGNGKRWDGDRITEGYESR